MVLSVDTWRHAVVCQACAAGADLFNETLGGTDPKLTEVAAEFGVGMMCLHAGGLAPRTDLYRVRYVDVVAEVTADLVARAERMLRIGVDGQGVLIGPTHDFGKNSWHGLELLCRVHTLIETGWPVLLALSNKDFIGGTLVGGVQDWLEGALAAAAVAARSGVRVFRAHHVAQMRRVVEMVASIVGTRPPAQVLRALA